MRKVHAMIRAVVYTLFSLGAGVLFSNVVIVVVGLGVAPQLPLGGVAAYAVIAFFLLAMFVFGQWEHFGAPVNLLKWIPLCLATLFAASVSMASLLD